RGTALGLLPTSARVRSALRLSRTTLVVRAERAVERLARTAFACGDVSDRFEPEAPSFRRGAAAQVRICQLDQAGGMGWDVCQGRPIGWILPCANHLSVGH